MLMNVDAQEPAQVHQPAQPHPHPAASPAHRLQNWSSALDASSRGRRHWPGCILSALWHPDKCHVVLHRRTLSQVWGLPTPTLVIFRGCSAVCGLWALKVDVARLRRCCRRRPRRLQVGLLAAFAIRCPFLGSGASPLFDARPGYHKGGGHHNTKIRPTDTS